MRYIRRVNGTDNGIQQTVPLRSLFRRLLNSWPGLEGYGRSDSDREVKPRLDPISTFLLFGAMGSIIALYVFTPGFSDLTTQATKYVIILAAAVIFAPILLGSYIFREWGPIIRPLYHGNAKKPFLPDIALIGAIAGFAAISAADFILTNFGFSPTLSFWNSLTPQIFYASGGIIEEFIFRCVFFGTVNRFMPGLLKNPAAFLVFTGPIDSGIFTVYHFLVYATSRVALDLVFVEGYIIAVDYRALNYPLWVAMLIHGAANWVSAP